MPRSKGNITPLDTYPHLVAELVGAMLGGKDKNKRDYYADRYLQEHDKAKGDSNAED